MNEQISILVAEDNQDDVFLLERAFKTSNYNAKLSIVSDGEEAISHLSQRDPLELPSLILLDLKMPRRTGHEVLQWIRSHKTLSKIVVVILTSSEEPLDIERARSLGANSYLVKTGGLPQFRALIEAIHNYWITHDRFVEIVKLGG